MTQSRLKLDDSIWPGTFVRKNYEWFMLIYD